MLPDLKTALLDLLYEIRDKNVELIIGGGFGVYLKTEHIRSNGLRTLLECVPETRSTNDIDLFLNPDILIHSNKLKPLSDAIIRLGYTIIKGAEKYQFVKQLQPTGTVKIDILTGPEFFFTGTGVKVDSRRVKPNPSVNLHAHPVNEAVTIEEYLLPVDISGQLSSDNPFKSHVLLPHPYTFLMMKLFAFKDRFNDSNKEFGKYHAIDIYTIVATIREVEWKEIQTLHLKFKDNSYVKAASEIVKNYFSQKNMIGIIRLQENRYFRPEMMIDEFISILMDIFPCT